VFLWRFITAKILIAPELN